MKNNPIVIKIGGSLCKSRKTLLGVLKTIEKLSNLKKIFIVPGGGILADTIREMDCKFKLPEETSHEMALLACDQMGLLIASQSEKFKPLWKLTNIRDQKISVILPSKIIMDSKLPKSGEITSDSIALYIASKMRVKTLIKLTDVDGLYTKDPRKNKNAKLITGLKSSKLNHIKEKCVDPKFGQLLKRYSLSCYIINGKHPERLIDLIKKGNTLGTLIKP